MSTTELNARHPQFARVIDALMDDVNHPLKLRSAAGTDVYFMHAILKDSVIRCNSRFGIDIILGYVIDITQSSKHSDYISLTGPVLETKTTSLGGARLPLIYAHETKTVAVSKAALSERYPDWEQRLAIGRGLGLECMELSRHVFSRETHPSIPIDSLTFD